MNRNSSDQCKVKFQGSTELFGHMNEEHTDESHLDVKIVIKKAAQLGKTTHTTGLIVKQADINVNPVSESPKKGPTFKHITSESI